MGRIGRGVSSVAEERAEAVVRGRTEGMEAGAGGRLWDVVPGADTNRTGVTFVGGPEPVAEAAFRAVSRAAELIDMRQHAGAHPRFGATDVVPFVPVSGVTMEDCAELARAVGERIGTELGIPVYLYENAASSPERSSLSRVRAGEYEGLAARLADPLWAPDFGPAEFNAQAGATAVGGPGQPRWAGSRPGGAGARVPGPAFSVGAG